MPETNDGDVVAVNPNVPHKNYKVTNKSSGPKTFNIFDGSQRSILRNKLAVLSLTDDEVADYKRLFKEISFEETDDEMPPQYLLPGVLLDKPSEPPTEAMPKDHETEAHQRQLERTQQDEKPLVKADDADKRTPDKLVHRGGGRYYGMAGDEVITDPMTKDEAQAYAKEHELTI